MRLILTQVNNPLFNDTKDITVFLHAIATVNHKKNIALN